MTKEYIDEYILKKMQKATNWDFNYSMGEYTYKIAELNKTYFIHHCVHQEMGTGMPKITWYSGYYDSDGDETGHCLANHVAFKVAFEICASDARQQLYELLKKEGYNILDLDNWDKAYIGDDVRTYKWSLLSGRELILAKYRHELFNNRLLTISYELLYDGKHLYCTAVLEDALELANTIAKLDAFNG